MENEWKLIGGGRKDNDSSVTGIVNANNNNKNNCAPDEMEFNG